MAHGVEMHGFESRELGILVKPNVSPPAGKKSSGFLKVNDALVLGLVHCSKLCKDEVAPVQVLFCEMGEYGEARLDGLHPGNRPVGLRNDDTSRFGLNVKSISPTDSMDSYVGGESEPLGLWEFDVRTSEEGPEGSLWISDCINSKKSNGLGKAQHFVLSEKYYPKNALTKWMDSMVAPMDEQNPSTLSGNVVSATDSISCGRLSAFLTGLMLDYQGSGNVQWESSAGVT
ncbi:hypothetical protein B0H10DRAFT_1959593 [Mycena sp. CBHHK59/15]|nr:hypothetical protein B0H10DRAFT_1959593 [Mycena sp. CBHHK59/15]